MENKLLDFPNFEGMDLQALAEGRTTTVKSEEKKEEEIKEATVETTEKTVEQPSVIDPSYGNLDELLKEDETKKSSNYEEEEEENPKEEPTSTDTNDKKEPTDVIQKFKDAVEFGTFVVPDDFEFDGSEEKFNEALELTRQHYFEQAEEILRENIRDPRLKELIEYGLQGGDFANLELFNQYQNIETNFENADIENEEVQKQILKAYYQTTAAALGENKINKLIEEDVETGKLKEIAINYRQWFVTEANREKARLQAEAATQREAERKAAVEYNKNFQKALAETKFADGKKSEILSSFSTTKLQDGREVLNWQYKLMLVQSNPESFIQLLDILNTYDEQKGFSFGAVASKVKSEERKSLFDKFKGKKESEATSSARKQEEQNRAMLRNPIDRYVKKL